MAQVMAPRLTCNDEIQGVGYREIIVRSIRIYDDGDIVDGQTGEVLVMSDWLDYMKKAREV